MRVADQDGFHVASVKRAQDGADVIFQRWSRIDDHDFPRSDQVGIGAPEREWPRIARGQAPETGSKLHGRTVVWIEVETVFHVLGQKTPVGLKSGCAVMKVCQCVRFGNSQFRSDLATGLG